MEVSGRRQAGARGPAAMSESRAARGARRVCARVCTAAALALSSPPPHPRPRASSRAPHSREVAVSGDSGPSSDRLQPASAPAGPLGCRTRVETTYEMFPRGSVAREMMKLFQFSFLCTYKRCVTASRKLPPFKKNENIREDKYDEIKRKINSKIWSTVHYQNSAPKIEIPEFSGNYSKWISFKDLFLETIHNNPMINKTQKMLHLPKDKIARNG